MRRFIVEVLLDAAIVFVILALLSFIHVPQPFPFGTTRVPILTSTTPGVYAATARN